MLKRTHGRRQSLSPVCQKFFHVQPDVAGNFPKEGGRNITTGMKRDGGPATVRMTVLPVRTALTDFLEAKGQQKPGDLPWLEDGNRPHA